MPQKTKPPTSQPLYENDLGTESIRNKPGYKLEKTDKVKRTRNKAPVPLMYYFNRGVITDTQKEAGEQWESDFYRSGASVSPTTSNYEALRVDGGGGSLDMSERQVFHHQRFSKAYNKLKERQIHQIAFSIICLGQSAKELCGTIPYYDYGPQFMPPLKQSLDLLIKFYRLR